MKCFVSLLILLVSFGSVFGGSLKWDSSTIVAQALPTDRKVEVEFKFSNTSKTLVELRDIRTSCGCTTAALSQRVFKPGETGSIKVIFTLEGRRGLQEKAVIVQTSNNEQDILTLRVEIPDSIKVNKEMLTWQIGDPLDEQIFEVEILAKSASIKGIRALDPTFEADFKQVKESLYKVSVRPTSTERPIQKIIKLEVADPNPRSVFLKVRVEG